MRYFYFIFATIFISGIFLSCKNSTSPEDGSGLSTTSFSLKYEKVCTPPIYQQSMMITGFDNKLFILGCWAPMIYDTLAKTWWHTPLPRDTVCNRWDGALAKFGNSIYVFGYPAINGHKYPKFYNVVKFDITASNYEALSEPLPIKQYEPYPAYAETGNKILIVYPRLDSIYQFDANTEKGKFVAANELKDITDTSLNGPYYAFGKYGNYLYLYSFKDCKLKKVDLTTFAWEEINIPQEVKNILTGNTYSNGAVFDGLLLLYRGTDYQALSYDIALNKWGYSNYDPESNLFFESRFTNDKNLYILCPTPTAVWKVTRVK